jgi:hypothetical protein
MSREQYKVSKSEFFSSKKSINLVVDREDYIAIRKKLVESETPFYTLFKLIIEDFIKDEPYTKEIIKKLERAKFKKSLERLEASEFVLKPPPIDYSFIDKDRMYDEIDRRMKQKLASIAEEDDGKDEEP